MSKNANITACIPALNEEKTIARVINGLKPFFKKIVVFDNNSDDTTAEVSRSLGAKVIRVVERGKGRVMKAIFSYCKSKKTDLFFVDADDTYSLDNLDEIIRGFKDCDMIICTRRKRFMKKTHAIANYLVSLAAGRKVRDICSGMRLLKYSAICKIKLRYNDFRTETEMTLKALQNNLKIKEVEVDYHERRESKSKLCFFRDGIKIFGLAIAG